LEGGSRARDFDRRRLSCGTPRLIVKSPAPGIPLASKRIQPHDTFRSLLRVHHVRRRHVRSRGHPNRQRVHRSDCGFAAYRAPFPLTIPSERIATTPGQVDSSPSVNKRLRSAIEIIVQADSKTKSSSAPQRHLREHLSLGASKPATDGRFKTSRGVDVQ
jgi:hypothetical protein